MPRQGSSVLRLALFCLLAAASIAAQISEKPRWVTLERGNRSGNLEFDKQNRVWMHVPSGRTYLWTAKAAYEIDALDLSPLSPTGRYQVVVDPAAAYGDIAAYLVDFKERKAHKLPLPAYVQRPVFWSPGELYLLMTRDYEEAVQVAVVSLPGAQVRELRPKGLEPWDGSCCGIMRWTADRDDYGRLEEGSVRWLDRDRFELIIAAGCSVYDTNCTTEEDWVRKVIKVEANAKTGKVKQRILKGTP